MADSQSGLYQRFVTTQQTDRTLNHPQPTSFLTHTHSSCNSRFKAAVKALKREVLALFYAMEDPSIGWLPRCLAVFVVAYALSPLDLIPDFIPILGLIDDLIILPALIYLTIKLIPHQVMEQARHRADVEPVRLGKNWVMGALFFLTWDILLAWLVYWACFHVGFAQPALQQYVWFIVAGVVAVVVGVEAVWTMSEIKKERERKEASDILSASLLEEGGLGGSDSE